MLLLVQDFGNFNIWFFIARNSSNHGLPVEEKFKYYLRWKFAHPPLHYRKENKPSHLFSNVSGISSRKLLSSVSADGENKSNHIV